jgi:phosphoribosylformylglycinamidine (FGAM) synthase-like enzyme
VGAEPLGLTNCLNFGNPEKPHVAWQLVEAVEGLAIACEELGVPVVGGNVSLYNEAPTGPIFPTPVVGMVGKLPDASRAGRLGFARAGDAVALVGPFEPSAVGSELGKLLGRAPVGELPVAEAGPVRDAHDRVRNGIRSSALQSAHDISDGGIAVALAECCIAGGIGARVRLPDGLDPFAEAFGCGFIVSGPAEVLSEFTVIGQVGGDALAIEGLLELAVSELREAWDGGLAEWV